MEQQVYNSNNDDAILKANGPFRLQSPDNSFWGFKKADTKKTEDIFCVGELKIYGKKSVGDTTLSSSSESQ